MKASRILALGIIMAVVIFLAMFSLAAVSFDDKVKTEPLPQPDKAAAELVCYIGKDLSQDAEYSFAKDLKARVLSSELYSFKVFDCAGKDPKEAITEAIASSPGYMIVSGDLFSSYYENDLSVAPDPELLFSGAAKVIITSCGDVSLLREQTTAGSVAYIGYSRIDANKMANSIGLGAVVSSDEYYKSKLADGDIDALVYLDNAALLNSIVAAVENGDLQDVQLKPELITSADVR